MHQEILSVKYSHSLIISIATLYLMKVGICLGHSMHICMCNFHMERSTMRSTAVLDSYPGLHVVRFLDMKL